MLSLSIVQGRLSAEVAGKYQHFPINNWRNEFFDAKRLGFIGIEWIISDFSNPIFDKDAANDIIQLVKRSGVKITSISLDLLMTKTIDQFDFFEIEWMLELIDKISKSVGLKRISFPISLRFSLIIFLGTGFMAGLLISKPNPGLVTMPTPSPPSISISLIFSVNDNSTIISAP